MRGGTTKLPSLQLGDGWGGGGQVAPSSPLTDWLGQGGAGKLAPCHSHHQHSGMLLLSSAKPSQHNRRWQNLVFDTLLSCKSRDVKRLSTRLRVSECQTGGGRVCVSICHTMTPNVSTNARTKCWSEYRRKAQI